MTAVSRGAVRGGVDVGAVFVAALRQAGLPLPEREHRFGVTRRWRFDFAWPTRRVAVELEGGVWTRGRHTRGSGFLRDVQKYNHAAALGWRVLRAVPPGVDRSHRVGLLDPVFLAALGAALTDD